MTRRNERDAEVERLAQEARLRRAQDLIDRFIAERGFAPRTIQELEDWLKQHQHRGEPVGPAQK